jgi:hypothetical protein
VGRWSLRGSDTFAAAAAVWLERLERLARLGQRSPVTVETYFRQLNGHVLPALGVLRLQEVTTPPLSGVDDARGVLWPAEPGLSRGGCAGGRRSDGLRRECEGICGAGGDGVKWCLPWSESWRRDSNS